MGFARGRGCVCHVLGGGIEEGGEGAAVPDDFPEVAVVEGVCFLPAGYFVGSGMSPASGGWSRHCGSSGLGLGCCGS